MVTHLITARNSKFSTSCMGRITRTEVWQYYTRKESNGKVTAHCKYCETQFANNATRMKLHLQKCKRCPPDVASVFTKKKLENTTKTTSGTTPTSVKISSDDSDNEEHEPQEVVHGTLLNVSCGAHEVSRGQEWEEDSPKFFARF